MAKRIKYCDGNHCQCEREVTIEKRPHTYTFRDENFEIIEEYAKCSVCGESCYDEELDTKTLQTLKKMYEAKYDYNPEKLKEIRLSFNLPQALFSKLLGMGIATIKRYETGVSFPDTTQVGIYKMLKNDPRTIKQFYEQTKGDFTADELQQIVEKLGPFLTDAGLEETSQRLLELAYKPHENTDETGLSAFNAQKLFHMILFFSKNGVLKTKLMKLLWFSDFLNFKRQRLAISGAPYWHLPFGPVPKNHDLVLGCLEGMDWIDIKETENGEGYTIINIQARETFNEKLFAGYELEVIQYVENYFQRFGSRAISDFAHKENAWKETVDNQIISYSYAESLQLN